MVTQYMTYQRLTRIYCYILLGVMAFFFYNALKLTYGAIYVKGVIVAIVILDILIILRSLSEQNKSKIVEQEKSYERLFTKQSIIILLAPVFNYLSWEFLYFIGGSFITMTVLFILQNVKPIKAVIVAGIVAFTLQLLFYNGFKVLLPTPLWWPNF